MAELPVVISCFCKAQFGGSEYWAAWEAFHRHAEDAVAADDPEHWIVLEATQTYRETRDMPTRERYGDLTEYLAAMIGWMAQVTHEAYHDSQMSVQACEQTLCREAKVALGEIGEGDGYGDGGT